ncbi:MAG: sodium:proton antiporter [Planctomycetota bacterium]|nr:sodium:proton antiporter [Planctomycetota bacterium]
MSFPDLIPTLMAFADQAKADPMVNPHTVSGSIILFTLLLTLAVCVGVVSKKLKVPYTVALVIAGLVVAFFKAAPDGAALGPHLVFYIVLPPILFHAGLRINLKSLGRNWLPVVIVTALGTLVTTAVVGIVIRYFLTTDMISANLIWVAAFMFGAMMSPTDPVSVIAVIKNIGIPVRVRTVIEGESLFNDGIAVTLFFLLWGSIFTGMSYMHGNVSAPPPQHHESPAEVVEGTVESIFSTGVVNDTEGLMEAVWNGGLTFLTHSSLGLLIGGLLGWAAVLLMRWSRDPVLENAITVVLAYGSFIIASEESVSGVAAVIVAGIIVGATRWHDENADDSIKTISTFWESIDYIINSLIFLLVGIELQFIGVEKLLDGTVMMAIGFVYLAMLVSRALVVYPAGISYGKDWPRGASHVVFWSGLRGCVTLALVLTLPASYIGVTPELKNFMLPVIFGVVLLTLLLQGTTMRSLIKLSGCMENKTDG